jgi:hypothetical protein
VKLVTQDDPKLNAEINRYGCRFRSLLAIAEWHTGKILTPLAIQQAYNDLVPGAMDVHCRCNENEHKIIRWGMRTMGSSARCYQIGIVYGCARLEFWPAAQMYTILKGLCHRKGEPGYEQEPGFHFRLGDRAGKLLFDPQPMAVVKEEHEVLVYQIIG